MNRAHSQPTKQKVSNLWTNSISMASIIIDVACDNIIMSNFNKETSLKEWVLFVIFLLLQIIAAPIQTGISDKLGRKKSLIIALFSTLTCMTLLFFNNLSLFPIFVLLAFSATIKGLVGNTIPIIWATIGDIDMKNERFFFAISQIAYGSGFLIVLFMAEKFSNGFSIFILGISVLISIYLCFIRFKDIHDPKDDGEISFIKIAQHEGKLIVNDLKQKALRNLCYSFLFLEISIYCILIRYTDFPSKGKIIALFMMIGYLLGNLMMGLFAKYSNKTMIKCGFIVSTFSLVPYIIMTFLDKNVGLLLIICYFVHSIGNAFLSPSFLSEVCLGIKFDEKGKRFGLMDSTDTIAVLIATSLLIFLIHYQLPVIYLVSVSFITMVIAWYFYKRYEKEKYIA